MPLPLPDRCRPDSVAEFRAAALRRYADGLALAESGVRERRTGAVYLWGYSVEMVLKAAVFAAFGYDQRDPIELDDLKVWKQLAASVGMTWGGALHAVDQWGRLIVCLRGTLPGVTPLPAAAARQVEDRSARVQLLWRETLRYHPNVAYPWELAEMREHCEWFLGRIDQL